MTAEENNDLKIQLAILTEKVTGWMDTTTEYRKNLCNKVDIITKNFSSLPCSERKGWYTSMGRQVSFMWLVLGLVLASVVGSAFIGMKERNQVMAEINTLKSK